MEQAQAQSFFDDGSRIPEPPAYLERQSPRPAPRDRKFTNRQFEGAPSRTRALSTQVTDLPPVEFDERGNWAVGTPEQELAVIRRFKAAGALPDSFENDVQIAFAIQALRASGMNVFNSIGHVAFIFGRYTEFDEIPLAKVLRSGELEHHDEYAFTTGEDGKYLRMDFENGNLHLPAVGVVCEIQRRGRPKKTFAYTQAEADRNGLGTKKGAWQTDPIVMMKRKARARAFNKEFADVLYLDTTGGGRSEPE